MTSSDWDLWNAGRNVSGVNVVGPFNQPNVLVSSRSNLTNAVATRSNGHWFGGVFYLGTSPGGADSDGEGIAARFHVGSNIGPSFGFVGDTRQNALWHLWLRE